MTRSSDQVKMPCSKLVSVYWLSFKKQNQTFSKTGSEKKGNYCEPHFWNQHFLNFPWIDPFNFVLSGIALGDSLLSNLYKNKGFITIINLHFKRTRQGVIHAVHENQLQSYWGIHTYQSCKWKLPKGKAEMQQPHHSGSGPHIFEVDYFLHFCFLDDSL